MHYEQRVYGMTSDMLLSMVTLPQIRTLEVQLIDEINDTFPRATSAMSTLHMLCSPISIRSLEWTLTPLIRQHQVPHRRGPREGASGTGAP